MNRTNGKSAYCHMTADACAPTVCSTVPCKFEKNCQWVVMKVVCEHKNCTYTKCIKH